MNEQNPVPEYRRIVDHYESCLEQFGDSYQGVDWPNLPDALKRYEVMLDVIKPRQGGVTLLDFGCGASHLYAYLLANERKDIDYAGLDMSEKFIELSRSKFPQVTYYCMDLLETKAELPVFDYVVMNGVFTEKRELSQAAMWDYFRRLLTAVFGHARIGVAFNVMSSHVDWEREDLFHLPMDELAGFLIKNLGRDFVIRNDYQLYEYTTYLYRR